MIATLVRVEGGFAFEVRAANGRLLATTTAFRRRADAEKALASMQEHLPGATVVHGEGA